MTLINSETMNNEQIQKSKNFIFQGCTSILAGKWKSWAETSDERNRYNKDTSRLEKLKSSRIFGVSSLPLMIYMTKDSIKEEQTQREDHEEFKNILNSPQPHLFLRELFGDPFTVMDNNKINSFGELYLYMINSRLTEVENEAFEKYTKALGKLNTKNLIYSFLLFEWYTIDPASIIYKAVDNYYQDSIIRASMADKLAPEEIFEIFEDLKEGFRFWSFLIPKMEGPEGKNFKKNFRKYFVPSRENPICEEPYENRVRIEAVINGLSAMVELGEQALTLKCPFPGYEEIALAQPYKN